MTPRVLGRAVGLDLDESRRDTVADQHLVEQLGRDVERVAVVERLGQGPSHACCRSSRSRASSSSRATGS
ncbi:MAG TPA: hypothetical protein VN636_15780, partial [Acidimicrobiia bacterium]|nr:hypothetical protein [Acidimicrobiia bacterium]